MICFSEASLKTIEGATQSEQYNKTTFDLIRVLHSVHEISNVQNAG